MTKEEILQTFSDISHAYNNSTKYDTLKRMLDELTEPCEGTISRQAAIDATWFEPSYTDPLNVLTEVRDRLKALPSAQPEQRYTEEELRVFAHGISLSLLSKRSAQHWRYDEDTATEIKFLERLYEKVGADIRGERDEE